MPRTRSRVRGRAAGERDAVIPRPNSAQERELTLSEWTGTFEGKRFDLTFSVSLDTVGALSNPSAPPELKIRGTYGTSGVTGTATSVGNSNELSFTGTVASHHIGGTITSVRDHGSNRTATARFTVSP